MNFTSPASIFDFKLQYLPPDQMGVHGGDPSIRTTHSTGNYYSKEWSSQSWQEVHCAVG